MTYQDSSKKKFIYLFLLPALFSLYAIVKVFYLRGCYGFDSNDEANHTFPNLFVAFQALRQGALPLMNLSNNFGTPLIGDCLTFPFSFLSLTYVFFEGPLASTINRALIIFASLCSLTVFYRRYFYLPVASLCAFLAVLTPGAFWNMAHHHYQAAIFFVTMLLIFQERLNQRSSFINSLIFYILLILFFLSVSANLVFYGIVFLFVNALFGQRRNILRRIGIYSILVTAALVFAWPEFYMFLTEASFSIRKSEVYGASLPFSEFVLSVLGGAVITFIQQYWLYVSWPILWLSAFGVFVMIRVKKQQALLLKAFLLGVLPLVFVWLVTGNVKIYAALPFIKSTDVTRILWISNIFLMLIVGNSIQSIFENKVEPKVFAFWIGIYIAYAALFQMFVGWSNIPWQYSLSVFFLAPVLLITLFCVKRKVVLGYCIALLLIGAAMTRIPVVYLILGQQHPRQCRVNYSHWYSDADSAYYPEPGLVGFLKPHSRITHEEETYWGRDFRLVYHDLFGVQARTPLTHQGMTDYLKKKNLIEESKWLTNYYLKRPWQPQLMRELGIRYLVQKMRPEESIGENWSLLAQNGQVVLLEQKQPTAVVYYMRDNEIALLAENAVTFKANLIEIELPAVTEETELVAAFIHRPHWRAYVDGEERELSHAENQMMRLAIRPGDQKAVIEFVPFKWRGVLLGAAASLAIFFAGFLVIRRRENVNDSGAHEQCV